MARTSKKRETPLAAFCQSAGIAVSKLARRADMSTPHLFDVFTGVAMPKQSTMDRLRRAAQEILGRAVSIDEMFFGQ